MRDSNLGWVSGWRGGVDTSGGGVGTTARCPPTQLPFSTPHPNTLNTDQWGPGGITNLTISAKTVCGFSIGQASWFCRFVLSPGFLPPTPPPNTLNKDHWGPGGITTDDFGQNGLRICHPLHPLRFFHSATPPRSVTINMAMAIMNILPVSQRDKIGPPGPPAPAPPKHI